MKYRTLSDEELKHFENELKAFLIINGVDGDTWLQINRENPEKARALVDLFSDEILQQVYEHLSYIEHRAKNSLLVFHFSSENIELIAIHTANEQLDLSTIEGIHDALTHHFSALEFFTSKKNFAATREQDIHQLLEQGAIPSDEQFWNSLKSVLKNP